MAATSIPTTTTKSPKQILITFTSSPILASPSSSSSSPSSSQLSVSSISAKLTSSIQNSPLEILSSSPPLSQITITAHPSQPSAPSQNSSQIASSSTLSPSNNNSISIISNVHQQQQQQQQHNLPFKITDKHSYQNNVGNNSHNLNNEIKLKSNECRLLHFDLRGGELINENKTIRTGTITTATTTISTPSKTSIGVETEKAILQPSEVTSTDTRILLTGTLKNSSILPITSTATVGTSTETISQNNIIQIPAVLKIDENSLKFINENGDQCVLNIPNVSCDNLGAGIINISHFQKSNNSTITTTNATTTTSTTIVDKRNVGSNNTIPVTVTTATVVEHHIQNQHHQQQQQQQQNAQNNQQQELQQQQQSSTLRETSSTIKSGIMTGEKIRQKIIYNSFCHTFSTKII